MKPIPKREVAVIFYHEGVRNIVFNSSKDAIEDFKEFGNLYDDKKDRYSLLVDGRYDFNEVLEYIKNYG